LAMANPFTLMVSSAAGQPTTASWIASTLLQDGNYRATLPAGSVSDAAGNPLASAQLLDFFVFAGDADHNRSIGFADLVAVAQNYGKSGNATFGSGDFNYDHNVNFS